MRNSSKYNVSRKKRIFKVLEAFLLGLLSVISVLLLSIIPDPISTEKADALYGGATNPNGHPYAGYIIDYSSVFSHQVCGITYLSNTIGITAAHCFNDTGVYYVGSHEFTTAPDMNAPIASFLMHPDWDDKTLSGDIAYVMFSRPVETVRQYADIAVPEVGCGYEVLAYGSREEKSLSNADLRRSANVCIEAVTNDRFYLRSPDGGVCFGDSGSPVFVKDSNKIVGIISAITVDKKSYSTDNCFVNNQAVATRADETIELINANKDLVDDSCPRGSGIKCADREVCRSNKCMKSEDFVFISALDYRSADFVLSGLSATAWMIILCLSSIFFALVLLVRVRGTLRLSR